MPRRRARRAQPEGRELASDRRDAGRVKVPWAIAVAVAFVLYFTFGPLAGWWPY